MMFDIFEADLNNPTHGGFLLQLMEEYACDPMGGGASLSPEVQANLIQRLAQWPGHHAVIAIEPQHRQPAGLINCFEGFSTFAAQPLLNIHDVIVSNAFRNQGLSQLMLGNIEAIAIRLGCCKLTLEVLAGNSPAQRAYSKFGFAPYQLDAKMGQALFWQKKL